MLGGELTKLKEQLKEVNNGADSVIENSEKLKNTIRKKIKEIKVHIVSLYKHVCCDEVSKLFHSLFDHMTSISHLSTLVQVQPICKMGPATMYAVTLVTSGFYSFQFVKLVLLGMNMQLSQ